MPHTTKISPSRTSASHAAIRLGERLRQLRVGAGMTQTDLAGARFSKEYVSQIERGKTRPTQETIDWLATRLGIDPGFLANGISTDERGRVDAALARAEALLEARANEEALTAFAQVRPAVAATGLPELQVRALAGEATARVRSGDVRPAIELLEQARLMSEGASFSDLERADVLYRLAVARYKLSSIQSAIGLFSESLALAERSTLPCDQLRSNILAHRSRCYRRRRDYEAARDDIERALELAEGLSDPRTTADAYLQASLIADREGHWVLARSYAERARAHYETLSDRGAVGRMLNNLGAFNFLLGKSDEAIGFLKESFRISLEVGNEAEAAQAVSSLAQVHLRNGDAALAEEQAQQALKLLAGRVDFLYEIGSAQLVLGRALLDLGQLDEAELQFAAAEQSFEQISSLSQRASVWIARGDLATRRGDDGAAAHLYRRAAEALEDVRF